MEFNPASLEVKRYWKRAVFLILPGSYCQASRNGKRQPAGQLLHHLESWPDGDGCQAYPTTHITMLPLARPLVICKRQQPWLGAVM